MHLLSHKKINAGLLGAVVIAAAAIVSVYFGNPAAAPVVLQLNGETMGTYYHIKVVGNDFTEAQLESVKREVEQELKTLNLLMSRYITSSEISRFNSRKNTDPVSVSHDLLDVLNFAQALSRKTDGAFDVTVGPLIGLWGFHNQGQLTNTPSTEQIEEAQAVVGYKKLIVDTTEGTIRKIEPALDVDLSSIAKGRGVDQVAGVLSRQGFANYMVEIGGEVSCSGMSVRGTPWRVGIEKPVGLKRETMKVVELVGKSMATSGDYRSFFKVKGKRYSHTIDPQTGRPVTHNLASVSVVHKECMKADAIATALTVLGPDKGFALADRNGWAAFFITRKKNETFTTRTTKAFAKLL